MAGLTHGDAQDLVDRLKRAWEKRDVDAFLDCLADDAELRPDPFAPPVGDRTALRAWANDIAATVVHAEADAEHIWLAGDTVLVAFHGAWTDRRSAARSRVRGMLALELDPARRVRRGRAWALTRNVGSDSTFEPTGEPAGAQPSTGR
jgi:ketosteroid isomerase-like protein